MQMMSSLYDVIATHPSMIEALRSTLKCLERNEDLSPADPAYVELKNSILRAIGELDLRKNNRSTA